MDDIELMKSNGFEDEEIELYKFLKCHTRSFNVLYRNNIRSIEHLLKLTDDDIFRLRRGGKLTQDYIKKCIKEYQIKKVKSEKMRVYLKCNKCNIKFNIEFDNENEDRRYYAVCPSCGNTGWQVLNEISLKY